METQSPLPAPTKPYWLSFDAGTGVLSGTPTNSNIGDHSVVLSATDAAGAVTTQNFTITVTTTLETNGDYELAHGSDKYYIIDDNDNRLGLTYLGETRRAQPSGMVGVQPKLRRVPVVAMRCIGLKAVVSTLGLED